MKKKCECQSATVKQKLANISNLFSILLVQIKNIKALRKVDYHLLFQKAEILYIIGYKHVMTFKHIVIYYVCIFVWLYYESKE